MFEEVCRRIKTDLGEVLSFPVECSYDVGEGMFFPQIYNVPFEAFDEVRAKVFDYSDRHYEELGTFCIPVIFTPEQTAECGVLPSRLILSTVSSWRSPRCFTVSDDDDFLHAA